MTEQNAALRPAYAATPRGALHYAQAGSGEPLLLLHATPGSGLGWRSIAATYEAIFEFDLALALRRMKAPTLVLELRPEDEAHLAAQAPAICELIPGSRSAMLEGCDASVFRHRPGQVAAAVLPFLCGR